MRTRVCGCRDTLTIDQGEAAQQAFTALVTAEMIEEAAIEEATQVVLAALAVEGEDSGQVGSV